MQWKVDGVDREALVVVSAQKTPEKVPLLFVFHGHGGNMRLAERGQAFHESWPEAIVVYPQGLPTPGYLGDAGGVRPGWQHNPGENDDRDLKFVDAIIATLRANRAVDDNRIYATGFSNGGFFCYLLWAERPQIFAAVAPGSAQLVPTFQLKSPKPAFIYGGRNDLLVRFVSQQNAIEAVRKINDCTDNGVSCGSYCTLFSSAHRTPLMTYIHDRGHVFVPAVRPLIVEFFKNHPRIN